uniref:Ubiquitin-like protease family profile domain-containing protein n=1 Tax=Ditylenchus dipsaci TaxID=166011 RepID=A0A915DNN5_9BILA
MISSLSRPCPVIAKANQVCKVNKKQTEKSKGQDIQVVILDCNGETENTDREILVQKFGISLTSEDLERLLPGKWLNDVLINYYMQLIVKKKPRGSYLPKVFALDSLFYTQLEEKGSEALLEQGIWDELDLFFYDLVGCLINIEIRSSNGEVPSGYYDSFHGDGSRSISLIKNFLKEIAVQRGYEALDPTNWLAMNKKNISMQAKTNGNVCGVFVCQYAECVTQGREIDLSQETMDNLREKMSIEIRRGELT